MCQKLSTCRRHNIVADVKRAGDGLGVGGRIRICRSLQLGINLSAGYKQCGSNSEDPRTCNRICDEHSLSFDVIWEQGLLSQKWAVLVGFRFLFPPHSLPSLAVSPHWCSAGPNPSGLSPYFIIVPIQSRRWLKGEGKNSAAPATWGEKWSEYIAWPRERKFCIWVINLGNVITRGYWPGDGKRSEVPCVKFLLWKGPFGKPRRPTSVLTDTFKK